MKFRVRCDQSFDDENDARALMAQIKLLSKKASSINEGADNEEISYCDLEHCGHDEGRPCEKIERVEIRKLIRRL
jgi:hypothetical protein